MHPCYVNFIWLTKNVTAVLTEFEFAATPIPRYFSAIGDLSWFPKLVVILSQRPTCHYKPRKHCKTISPLLVIISCYWKLSGERNLFAPDKEYRPYVAAICLVQNGCDWQNPALMFDKPWESARLALWLGRSTYDLSSRIRIPFPKRWISTAGDS